MFANRARAGHKGKTRDNKGHRPHLRRDHPYSDDNRIRLITRPPVGFSEDGVITLRMAFPRDTKASEIVEIATAVLAHEKDPPPFQVTATEKGLAECQIHRDLIPGLSEAVRKEGTFHLDGEELPRGIYVLEPEAVCPNVTRETQWHLRFPGANASIGREKMFDLIDQGINQALATCGVFYDRGTLKKTPENTAGAVSATRVWEMWLRGQENKGDHMIKHNLLDPWILELDGGVRSSHTLDRGEALENATKNEIVEDGVRLRGPPTLEMIVKDSVSITADMMEEEGAAITPMFSPHTWPQTAYKMVNAGGPIRNCFGVIDSSIVAIKVLAKPATGLAEPREIMARMTALGFDPIVAKTAVWSKLRLNNSRALGSIAVTKVLVHGVQNLMKVDSIFSGEPDTNTSVWEERDSFRPRERFDYWSTPEDGLILTPPVGATTSRIEAFMSLMEDGATEAAAAGMAMETSIKGDVTHAAAELQELIHEEYLMTIETKKREREENIRAMGGRPVKKETQGWRNATEPAGAKEVEEEPWEEFMTSITLTDKGKTRTIKMAYNDIRIWAHDCDRAENMKRRDLRFVDAVKYGVHTGKIPLHLGLGNEQIRQLQGTEDAIVRAVPVLRFDDESRVKSRQLLSSPLKDFWKCIQYDADETFLSFEAIAPVEPTKEYTLKAKIDEEDTDSEPDKATEEAPAPGELETRMVSLTADVAQFTNPTLSPTPNPEETEASEVPDGWNPSADEGGADPKAPTDNMALDEQQGSPKRSNEDEPGTETAGRPKAANTGKPRKGKGSGKVSK